MLKPAWTKEEFEQQLRAKGAYYHIHHPFHKRMNAGHCSKEEIQGWVANRLYSVSYTHLTLPTTPYV